MSADRTRILVTGTGGPSGYSFLQALQDEPVECFSADIDPLSPGLYLVPPDRRLLLPRGDDPGFADAVLELCERHDLRLVVPTVDSELLPLADRRDDFEAIGASVLVGSSEALRLCLDKWLLMQRCEGLVPIPRSAPYDLDFDVADWELPILAKPRQGSGSRGVRVIEAPGDLDGVERDGSLLIQAHLPGTEYSLDTMLGADGEVRAVVPRARLKVDSGIAITSRTVHDPELERIGGDAARAVGLTGVANVQVKDDPEGTPRLIEINPRFPGTMPLTIASGVDMPVLLVREALGTPLAPGRIDFEDLVMTRCFREIYFQPEELEALDDRAAAVSGPAG
jgi:carbamoyl-phosphate synthase large subunit